jgi:hypothetical protein
LKSTKLAHGQVAMVLPKEAVLPIFWILPIFRPMFPKGTRTSFPLRRRKESSEMKPTLLLFTALCLLAVVVGCACNNQCLNGSCSKAPETCQSVEAPVGPPPGWDPGEGGPRPSLAARLHRPAADAGPPTGAITYPYYTTRGPRDFLAKNPESIGP